MSIKRENKRHGARVSLSYSNAKIDTHHGLFAFFKGASKAAPIVDISEDGLRLLSHENMPKDKTVAMTVLIPSLSAKPLKMEGQVIWTKKFKPFEMYFTGIRFTSMLPSIKERLIHLVSFLDDKSRKIGKISRSGYKTHRFCEICQLAKNIHQPSFGFSSVSSEKISNQ